jgi:hypothetical protein
VESALIPAGYMAKRVAPRPEFLKVVRVEDVYSVSSCVNDNFADYVDYWKHNGYWLFDRPEIILSIAQENGIDLAGTMLFYYEVYGLEFDGKRWNPYSPSEGMELDVAPPKQKRLEGYDVVTFFAGNSPECSPLSCNGIAEDIPTNNHCLLDSFEEAKDHLEGCVFLKGEPGPYRIFAVYSLDWPGGSRGIHAPE